MIQNNIKSWVNFYRKVLSYLSVIWIAFTLIICFIKYTFISRILFLSTIVFPLIILSNIMGVICYVHMNKNININLKNIYEIFVMLFSFKYYKKKCSTLYSFISGLFFLTGLGNMFNNKYKRAIIQIIIGLLIVLFDMSIINLYLGSNIVLYYKLVPALWIVGLIGPLYTCWWIFTVQDTYLLRKK
ncbi:MAG: hypothetical protein IKF79_07370 [Methanosphaera sp.]|nr:hypothetical protein [Methanosphaera sp.]